MGRCSICGQFMPRGEEMFRFHGLSGPCPIDPKKLPLGELQFEPGDFEPIVGYHRAVSDQIAERANEILRQRLSQARQVFGDNKGIWGTFEEDRDAYDTHQARVVCIEPRGPK